MGSHLNEACKTQSRRDQNSIFQNFIYIWRGTRKIRKKLVKIGIIRFNLELNKCFLSLKNKKSKGKIIQAVWNLDLTDFGEMKIEC